MRRSRSSKSTQFFGTVQPSDIEDTFLGATEQVFTGSHAEARNQAVGEEGIELRILNTEDGYVFSKLCLSFFGSGKLISSGVQRF